MKAHKLKFASYTTHVGFGGYTYVVCREPADPKPELKPKILGTTHSVWLNDEKNSWYIGQCDTIAQALKIIGGDIVRHANDMAEMASYDEAPNERFLFNGRLIYAGYSGKAVSGGYIWEHGKLGTDQRKQKSGPRISPTMDAAFDEAFKHAVRVGLLGKEE